MSTLHGVEIPESWTVEQSKPDNRSTVIEAPNSKEGLGGGVTIRWDLRKYALGYGARPNDAQLPRVGRGWRTVLVRDAIKALQGALVRFKSPN